MMDQAVMHVLTVLLSPLAGVVTLTLVQRYAVMDLWLEMKYATQTMMLAVIRVQVLKVDMSVLEGHAPQYVVTIR